MRPGQKGFTLIELLISSGIAVLVAASAGLAIFQIFRTSGNNSDYMTAVRQVESAGYWISRDAQRAETINTMNGTVFVGMSWRDWTDPNTPVYHSTNYTFTEMSGGIGKLERVHKSDTGDNETTLIAESIYYVSGDNTTCEASYLNSVLTVQVAARSGDYTETRQYKIRRRPE